MNQVGKDIITIHPKCPITKELNFKLFRYKEFICCIVRMGHSGCLNGYVAVDKTHPFYKKDYSDKIKVEDINKVKFNKNYIFLLTLEKEDIENNELRIDLALNVHGGITYSDNCLIYIEDGLFGDLWWFGFNTSHAWDIKPYQTYIDRKHPLIDKELKYRDFDYVERQTKKLANQLKTWKKKSTKI